MSLLSVKNFCISFPGNIKTIDNLTFTLEDGKTLGIVGESGSGKSLTGLSIIGLLPQSAKATGEIIFNDGESIIDILKLSDADKCHLRGKSISMIFQEPMTALNPVMKCGRQIDEILEAHTDLNKIERLSRIIELLEQVKIPNPKETINKYPYQLSGGQRQRIMIAMAIACNPRLLIADEPTTALDVTVQASIIDLIKELQSKYKIAVIFISHDLDVISKVSDDILVMYKGKMVELGSKESIINSPNESYTKGLIACKPSSKVRLKVLPTVDDFLTNNVITDKPETENLKDRMDRHSLIYSLPPMLEIRNVNLFFNQGGLFLKKKSFQALKNVDFKIYKGETVGLVGESGSGKTTLGRTIMQLISISEGAIFYNGQEITSLTGAALKTFRKSVQLVFQDPYSSLNPNHTIGHSIEEPMKVHHIGRNSEERKQRVLELLHLTGLPVSFYERYPHQLSGGQRQRVVIARALSLNPSLLVCDESVSALDVSVQAQILNLLNYLKDKLGLTYLFISHDLSVIKYLSDRIYVMQYGKIVEYGEADELCESPKEEYTRVLLSAAFNR